MVQVSIFPQLCEDENIFDSKYEIDITQEVCQPYEEVSLKPKEVVWGKEEEKKEEIPGEKTTKRPGRNIGKENREEIVSRDKFIGTQMTINKSLVQGTRSIKILGGRSHKPK
jgi:hypothetical protein